MALDGDGARIAEARQLAASFLHAVGELNGVSVIADTVEIAQLVVSELVTNARKYAPGPALLHLRVVGSVLHIDLWDSNPVLPEPKGADPTRIGQHGLEIVKALAQNVSVEAANGGKHVIAALPITYGAS
ncbi:ATP-binding protein [Streptomyces sp. NBC_00687]|uniref:ATP-binding protein n=1 Tax=Streptomyces sp. NBC_00687 TaxID=2975807 RepID=UPI002251F6EF|nr:ATP-binding protein [Streptomyces sp. NBC_00687]MCX4918970.1 ATP-binding protein [Streptomyces sp. NBC_00687]